MHFWIFKIHGEWLLPQMWWISLSLSGELGRCADVKIRYFGGNSWFLWRVSWYPPVSWCFAFRRGCSWLKQANWVRLVINAWTPRKYSWYALSEWWVTSFAKHLVIFNYSVSEKDNGEENQTNQPTQTEKKPPSMYRRASSVTESREPSECITWIGGFHYFWGVNLWRVGGKRYFIRMIPRVVILESALVWSGRC